MKWIEFYLDGILFGHIAFFLITFRYVYFLRKKSYTLAQALDSLNLRKRYKIVGRFFGWYPKGRGGQIDMAVYADISEVKRFVGNDKKLSYSDEVALSGKFLFIYDDLRLYKVHTLYALSKPSIIEYLNKQFKYSIAFGYLLALLKAMCS